ncbi:MAG: hypothetical protein K2Q18_14460, partial [Bdellovibrionales bacterium]|nr:hypothetical protein [Bdellovibrionales bacterium]
LNEELVELAAAQGKKPQYYLTDHGFYEIQDSKVISLMLFNEEELQEFKNGEGFIKHLDFQNPAKALNCFDIMGAFFKAK